MSHVAKNSVSRSGKNLKWQGTVSTILVAAVYCISILPYLIYVFVGYSGADFVIDPRSFFRTHYDRITKSFVSINTVSNFYIYSMTVISFREFLWSSRFNVFKLFTSTTDDTTVQYQNSRTISSVSAKSIFDQHFQEVPNSYRPLIPSSKTMRCFAMSVNNFAAHHLILMRTHEHLVIFLFWNISCKISIFEQHFQEDKRFLTVANL